MKLSGKLTFNAVAIKHIEIEKTAKSSIISIEKDTNSPQADKLSDFADHPLQGEVVAVGPNVTVCIPGDIVLLKVNSNYTPNPYMINDKGTVYSIYNEGDIALVRTDEEHTTSTIIQ